MSVDKFKALLQQVESGEELIVPRVVESLLIAISDIELDHRHTVNVLAKLNPNAMRSFLNHIDDYRDSELYSEYTESIQHTFNLFWMANDQRLRSSITKTLKAINMDHIHLDHDKALELLHDINSLKVQAWIDFMPYAPALLKLTNITNAMVADHLIDLPAHSKTIVQLNDRREEFAKHSLINILENIERTGSKEYKLNYVTNVLDELDDISWIQYNDIETTFRQVASELISMSYDFNEKHAQVLNKISRLDSSLSVDSDTQEADTSFTSTSTSPRDSDELDLSENSEVEVELFLNTKKRLNRLLENSPIHQNKRNTLYNELGKCESPEQLMKWGESIQKTKASPTTHRTPKKLKKLTKLFLPKMKKTSTTTALLKLHQEAIKVINKEFPELKGGRAFTV